MQATDLLMDEHRTIKRVLRMLQQAAREIQNGKHYPPAMFEQAVDFLRTFADRCHHLKEQDILFQEMEKMGIPVQGGPLGVMLKEHDQGRALVKGMAEAIPGYRRGDAQATKTLADNARSFANLLSAHIDKEDNILYPMANLHLENEDQESLLARFEAKEKEMGEGVHERYRHVVEELEMQVLGQTQAGGREEHSHHLHRRSGV